MTERQVERLALIMQFLYESGFDLETVKGFALPEASVTYVRNTMPDTTGDRRFGGNCLCGARRGMHRYGDEACPNSAWRCGNGQPQWWEVARFTEAPTPPLTLTLDQVIEECGITDEELAVIFLKRIQLAGDCGATEEELERAVFEFAIEKVLHEMADKGELIRTKAEDGNWLWQHSGAARTAPMLPAPEPPTTIVYARPGTLLAEMVRNGEFAAARARVGRVYCRPSLEPLDGLRKGMK